MTHGPLPAELWDGPAIRAAVAERHFGRLLRAYRDASRISQARLAQRLGLTQGQISRLETAARPPSDLAKLSRWAEVLGVPPRLLWFEAANEPVVQNEPDGMTALFDRLEGHATPPSRGDVLRNAADAYLRSGWAAYFSGRAAAGQRHLDMAVRIARDTSDHVLIAQCLAAHTHQALFYSPSIAVALSRQTVRAADRAGLTRLRAEAKAMTAYALALHGDTTQSLALVQRNNPSTHCAYLTGETLRVAGRPREAEHFARHALIGLAGPTLNLGNLFTYGLLCAVLTDQRRIEEACAAALRACRNRTRPVRGDAYLADIARGLAPFRARPEVRTLYARFVDIGVPTPPLSLRLL